MENPYLSPQTDPSQPNNQLPYTKPTLMQTLFSFSGRVPRRVYWGVSVVIMAIFYAILFSTVGVEEDPDADPGLVAPIIMLVFLLPFLWINLAIGVKRWHDRDKSGWMILVGMIPIVGPIWTLVECGCMRGTEGPNQYGADPT